MPQGSVLGPLFFLIYINDLVDNVSSGAKLFADDTSLFTVVYDAEIAADKLNRDLDIISNWAHQWKMQFNPDINQHAIQVTFPRRKVQLSTHPSFSTGLKLQLNRSINILVSYSIPSSLFSHTREAIIKARSGIGIIRFLSKYVSRDVLDQTYKLYVRPHLDYGDIIYHKYDPEFKLDFTRKLESTQYLAALTVSGAWRGVELILTSFMKNFVGKFFTKGGGIGACVTSTNRVMIRDPCTYSLKYLKNVPFTTLYVNVVHVIKMLKVLRDSVTRIFKTV